MSFKEPAPLASSHDLSTFDCGNDALNSWLRRHALRNQESRAARCFVVAVRDRVVGYYALAAGSVVQAEATGKIRRNMPESVPMALLGRLAVDKSAQGFGVGAGLLQDALLRVVQASDHLGIRGVLVDAIDDKAAAFYMKFGFRPSGALPLKLMVTLSEIERCLK